jgi:GntR family transcriptional regulator/MocR family aminotransferase
MPLGRRLSLLKWAEEADRYVLEDDYDSEFRFSGLPIPALQGLDRSEKVLYLNSFSKSLAPSLRIGYLVLPRKLVPAYREIRTSFPCSVPAFEQAVLTSFMEEGGFERHVNRMKSAYKEKRDHLIRLLRNSRFGSVAEIRNHDAGLHFLLRIANGMNERELVKTAAESGVGLAGLSDHLLALDPSLPEATLVIGYSGMKRDSMAEAVRRLETAWAKKR